MTATAPSPDVAPPDLNPAEEGPTTHERIAIEVDSGGSDDISLRRVRYTGRAEISGEPAPDCTIIVTGHAEIAAHCRIDGASLYHHCEPGNITIIPASCRWAASLSPGASLLFLRVPTHRLALATAMSDHGFCAIAPQMRGRNPVLSSIVHEMELASGEPGGAVWHFLADELADHLVASWSAIGGPRDRGRLSVTTLATLNAYIDHRLVEPIIIDTLADVAGCSRSHFPRLVRRTLGVSPHQYVMRVRLRRARELIDRGCAPAEAAMATGFSDQSHLTHWMRRLYGTTPGALASQRRSAETYKRTRPSVS